MANKGDKKINTYLKGQVEDYPYIIDEWIEVKKKVASKGVGESYSDMSEVAVYLKQKDFTIGKTVLRYIDYGLYDKAYYALEKFFGSIGYNPGGKMANKGAKFTQAHRKVMSQVMADANRARSGVTAPSRRMRFNPGAAWHDKQSTDYWHEALAERDQGHINKAKIQDLLSREHHTSAFRSRRLGIPNPTKKSILPWLVIGGLAFWWFKNRKA